MKLKDAAAHNPEFYFQEGGAVGGGRGQGPGPSKFYSRRRTRTDPLQPPFRLGFLNDLQGNDHDAIWYYERCLEVPARVGKGVLYNLGVLYEDHDHYDKAPPTATVGSAGPTPRDETGPAIRQGRGSHH